MFQIPLLLTLPPRAAETARSTEGTSQEDGRLKTKREAIFNIRLFYCHALGQIPRLIDVRAAKHRNVVGQQL